MSLFDGLNKQFYKDIEEKIEDLTNVLCSGGNIESFEEYKRLVGYRRGLLESVERHKELVSLMENANDR